MMVRSTIFFFLMLHPLIIRNCARYASSDDKTPFYATVVIWPMSNGPTTIY